MSELEKKFKEFIKTNYLLIASLWITKQLIKDLAEIAEKEKEKDEDTILRLDGIIITLKKQIENIKYLDRKKVGEILEEAVEFNSIDNGASICGFDSGQAINEICSLAIPITKEKIIEVLEKYFDNIMGSMTPEGLEEYAKMNWEKVKSKIASEILGDNNENN